MKDYAVYGLLGLFLYAVFRIMRVGRRPANYPPGPPTLPILGNIHQVLGAAGLLSTGALTWG
jgi:hypothetical protein